MDLEDLRLTIYRSFATTGAVEDPPGLAASLGVPEAQVRQGIRDLAEARHLAIDGDDRVLMAHPFASVPLGFAVMGRQTLLVGRLRLGLLRPAASAPRRARRPGLDPLPLLWSRAGLGRRPRRSTAPATRWRTSWSRRRRIWDDVVHTCNNQRLFCSSRCVDDWLVRTGNARGYLLDSARCGAWLAHWYDGRLDRGYQRRDPTTAAAYFRDVGLTGPFWGL